MSTMTTTSLSLAKSALQARLAQIEELERAREELARKAAEIEQQEEEIQLWLAGEKPEPQQAKRRLLGGSACEAHAKAQSEAENGSPAQPKTQKEWIRHLLIEHGAMNRDELFEKMVPTGKAPASVDQLSAILSRGKKDGKLGVGADFRWYPIAN